ncbi:MAG: phospho-N-acetylmuramoyl-pentapeptide-transferase, partial [Planctomycetota bacterium]
LALLFGPRAIGWLRERFREEVRSASDRLDALHAGKSGTPTMGGLFTVAAVLIGGVVWGDLSNQFVLSGLWIVASLAALGAADDWVKLRTERRGLNAGEKLAAQFGLAAFGGVLLQSALNDAGATTDLVLPVGGWTVPLGVLFVPWAALVTAAGSNAVNLTDGLDGLAAGCAVVAGAAMTGFCYLAGHAVWAEHFAAPHIRGGGELAVLLSAATGGMLGFLWFNTHPAEVFMGDTGALSFGGLLAFCATAVRQEALLVLVAGVFVAEAGSVIMQMGCKRLLGFKPIACSPLHNHFVFRGHAEGRIVVRFWIGSAVCAAAAFASLNLR